MTKGQLLIYIIITLLIVIPLIKYMSDIDDYPKNKNQTKLNLLMIFTFWGVPILVFIIMSLFI